MIIWGPWNRKARLILALWAGAPIVAGASASAAYAGSFKQNMQQMNETTKAAKAELGAFNAGNAAVLLRAYAEEAREGGDLSAGNASPKWQDLRARFARLASTAQASAAAASDERQFRKAFVEIVTQCKSCHSAYK